LSNFEIKYYVSFIDLLFFMKLFNCRFDRYWYKLYREPHTYTTFNNTL